MREKKEKNLTNDPSSEPQRKKKKGTKNREIFLVTVFFAVLILAMMWNIVDFQLHDSEEAINNSYNPRQEILANQNIRGSILASGGEVLAQTKVLADGSEQRIYPYKNLFAHIVGYATKGKTGIEASENMNMLTSHASLGSKIQKELNEEKSPGDNVVTTLDVSLQQTAYDTLGVYSGVIIVTEPSTGRILAMVSKPDFDPNEIAQIWDDLVEDESSSVLLNRATQGLYPPGSTFKIVTALEYYRENGGDVSPYSFQCGGRFTKDGSTIRCYHGASHGSENFERSFAKSCNSSFANIGTTLSIHSFYETCEQLLFNREFKMSIPYTKSSFRLSETDDIDTIMQTAIGQGKTQITPMHLNMITAAIANDGTCMTPYVVERIESANGLTVKKNTPSKEQDMMTVQEAEFLRALMTDVVEEGTASKLKGLSYTAAGKTGSAEFSANKTDSHAWFTGFAPAENPQVCITVLVESAGSGGDYAVPIAKRVLDCFFESHQGSANP